MTFADALAESKRRWGEPGRAFAEISDGAGVYSVGAVVRGVASAYGEGTSWEAAFADADARTRGGR